MASSPKCIVNEIYGINFYVVGVLVTEFFFYSSPHQRANKSLTSCAEL